MRIWLRRLSSPRDDSPAEEGVRAPVEGLPHAYTYSRFPGGYEEHDGRDDADIFFNDEVMGDLPMLGFFCIACVKRKVEEAKALKKAGMQ